LEGITGSKDASTLFVVDSDKIKRLHFSGGDASDPSNWTVNTIAGGTVDAFADGTGDLARFAQPRGITMSTGGVLYVVEFQGNRIRRIRFTGGDPTMPTNYVVSTVSGDKSTTYPFANHVDGSAATARFANPSDICIDLASNLYVVALLNNDVRKISA